MNGMIDVFIYIIFLCGNNTCAYNTNTTNIDFNSTDFSTVMQQVINNSVNGNSVFIKCGDYYQHTSIIISSNLNIKGESTGGLSCSKIFADNGIGPQFNITLGKVSMTSLTLSHKGGQRNNPSDDGILLNNAGRVLIDNIFISDQYNGIHLKSAGLITIQNSEIRNSINDQILLEGNQAASVRLDNLELGWDNGYIKSKNGIEVQSIGGLYINGIDQLYSNNGLYIDPNNNAAQDILITNSMFDSNVQNGIAIYGKGNTNLTHVFLSNVWSSSNGNNGIWINSQGATVQSIHLNNFIATNNAKYGVSVSNIKDFVLSSSTISDNSQSQANLFDDIVIYSVSNCIISNNDIGNLWNTIMPLSGVHLAGSNNNVIISNNVFSGISGKTINDSSTTGSTILKVNNLGV